MGVERFAGEFHVGVDVEEFVEADEADGVGGEAVETGEFDFAAAFSQAGLEGDEGAEAEAGDVVDAAAVEDDFRVALVEVILDSLIELLAGGRGDAAVEDDAEDVAVEDDGFDGQVVFHGLVLPDVRCGSDQRVTQRELWQIEAAILICRQPFIPSDGTARHN